MTTMDMQDMSFSFLTSGPTLRLAAPNNFMTPPQLSTPILSGVGPRSFDFTPAPFDRDLAEGMARDAELVEILTDRDGKTVELYARQDPTAWWLRWPLSTGCLATHLREEDGEGRARTITGSLSIDDAGPTPFLLLSDPLARAVSADPRFQETADSYDLLDGSTTITFMRPGFVAEGDIVSFSEGDLVGLRAGTKFGTEVQVGSTQGLESAQDLMGAILDSLTEA